MIGSIINALIGGGIFGEARRAYVEGLQARLGAETSERKIELDRDLERLEAAVRMAEITRGDPWSATSIGRYLIVIPFGVWWALIFADSIFAFEWNVLAIPPAIMDLAIWLVPAIIIGDVTKSGMRRIASR